ncbi:MAG: alanine--glyoxylate aminotransferase family protein [Thaumarchaeota archaeon]|nr:alanine--glyoxylate aminotransferase family protein [Nitrososphaerota archaeon]
MDYPPSKLLMLPGPTNVPDRVNHAMIRSMINHRGETFTRVLKGVTEKSRALFQTEGDPIILTASGTGGVEAAVWNIVRPGDKVVIPVCGEFGSRLAEVIELAGGETVRVTSEPGTVPSIEAVEEAVRKTPNLKAVYTVHNETSGGTAIPYVERLAKVTADAGAFFVVDAISSLGGYALPVDRWGIDICVTGSQKCLAAPPGLALLSVSKKAADFVRKSPPKVRYFDLGRQMDFLAHGETPFTPAVSLYYALDEALNWLIEEGLDKRVERHALHARTLYSLLGAMGLKGLAEEKVRSNTVVAGFYPPGIDDKVFRKKLSDEHDLVIGAGVGGMKGKVFRIGSMGNVSSAHVNRTATAMALTFQKMGYPVDLGRIASVLGTAS